MPFCAAAAVILGHPTIDTFDLPSIRDKRLQEFGNRVSLRSNAEFDKAAPLSQSRVTIRLRDGRTLTEFSDGARGYPGRLSKEELAGKFMGCAQRSLSRGAAEKALEALLHIETVTNVSELTALCAAG